MLHITDGTTVHRWIDEKQALETELAWELLEIFNTDPGLIGPLREMAAQALDELHGLKGSSPIASAAVTQAWQSQIGIVPLCAKYAAGFNSIEPDRLDAQECSDLIRLYGEFIEKAGALGARGPGEDYARQEALKAGYRVGADRWATEKQRADVLQGYGRLRVKVPAGTQSTSDVHAFLISMQGGAARFELTDASTVNRIDHVFGLAPLADISGTTTDTIYFTHRFVAPTGGDPVFYVLPLATIVALAHHSLLEVALSLSINHIVDYRIGFYTTLLPAGAQQAAGAIHAALAAAEMSPRNRLVLVYHARGEAIGEPGLPAGAFLYEPADRLAFRQFAHCVDVLNTFPWMAAWPNENHLRDYCAARGLPTP